MNVAIIDAEIVGKTKHRFPNLACMKISAWHKNKNNTVVLKTDFKNLEEFDHVFISKVFTKTKVPDDILLMPNVQYGGTGFFYDKAPPLPYEIEHIMPDYHLYDNWVAEKINGGGRESDFKYYTDYSIGFVTRGCFRQCDFCINKNSTKSVYHSPLNEFVDPSRKKICLLDDNFFACTDWKKILKSLQDTKKPFQFKQGLDERLLTDEKCEMLFNSKYDGEYIFAFDNIDDLEVIKMQLQRIRRYTERRLTFYVLCGFDRENKWDESFWFKDITDMFLRIGLLGKYRCLPYIMRFEKYTESPYKDIYTNVARWCNQPWFFKNTSFIEFCLKSGENSKAYKTAKYFSEQNKIFDNLFQKRWFEK